MAEAGALRFEARPYDDQLVQRLVAELQQEFVSRYGGPDAAQVDPDEFTPPLGAFLIGFDAAGRAVATGAYRVLADAPGAAGPRIAKPELEVAKLEVAEIKVAEIKVAEIKVAEIKVAEIKVAEIKRMYVPAQFRRRGYARAVLQALETAARAAGVERLVLNTGYAQPEAVALYEALGWRTVDPFGHYAHAPGALFYGRDLG